jgi:putative oxidoreductase
MNALCNLAKTCGPLLGRVLMSLLFLLSAFGKVTGFPIVAAGMTKKGIPFAEFLLLGAIACEVLGSLALVLGWKARWGALLLIIFMIPATLLYHDFWNAEAAQYRNQLNHFMKNLTIFGALIFLLGMGPGPLSLEKSKGQAGS